MKNKNFQVIIYTGMIGLLAAVLVGAGEFLLHFDPLARYSTTDYNFMLAASYDRQTLGHFIGVLSGPLYVVGCWHIYLMLRPANQKLALVCFLIGAYGFMIGGVWVGSRASIGALMHAQGFQENISGLESLYKLRYENLLVVIRVTTVIVSLLFIYLTITGRSYYRRWQVIFNPILLLLASFGVYQVNPAIGKYVMPITLNVAFCLFFVMSLMQAFILSRKE